MNTWNGRSLLMDPCNVGDFLSFHNLKCVKCALKASQGTFLLSMSMRSVKAKTVDLLSGSLPLFV